MISAKFLFAYVIIIQGFIVGHITPEAYVGGPIALIRTGDQIDIDAKTRLLNVNLTPSEFESRRKEWEKNPPAVVNIQVTGALGKFRKLVGSASEGCMTDM